MMKQQALGLPSAENTDSTSDFIVSSNDRIYFSFFRQGCQINGIFLQRVKSLLGRFGLHASVTANLLDSRFQRSLVQAYFFQDGPDRRIFEESEKKVILGNIGIVHHLLEILCLSQDFDSCGTQRSILWGRTLRRKANNKLLDGPFQSNLEKSESVRIHRS